MKKGGNLAEVPNLTFKDMTGAVCAHPISYVPSDWRQSRVDYGRVILVGDIQAGGQEHAYRFLDALARYKVNNMVVFEFWDAPPKELYERIARSLKEWNFEISCESQDEHVRKLFTKAHFTNEQFRQSLIDGLEAGAKRADVYLFVGIPFQTKESILAIPEFAEYLYDGLNGERKKLVCCAAPLAPFVDPGSLAFEKPERFGFRIVRTTLEEHREAMLKPSWKYWLNYESDYIDRDALVEATYDCALKLNEVKRRLGAVDGATAERVRGNILKAKEIIEKIDRIYMAEQPERVKEKNFCALKDEMVCYLMSTVCGKQEFEWSVSTLRKFKVRGVLKAALTS